MMDTEQRIDEEIQDVSHGRPHVLILGAGASLAAFPNGDKNGRMLPLMTNIINVLNLAPILKDASVDFKSQNFEVLYSTLSENPLYEGLCNEVEKIIVEYFSSLELPDHPTLFDHIVLSLREKDVIATFNWDPFLVQAYERNKHIGRLPRMIFLHGNVGIGYCNSHSRMIIGYRGWLCGECGQILKNSRLLYPVTKKDYQTDPFIKAGWHDLQYALKNAYILTIFGYSAPTTDVEAVELMKTAWGDVSKRQFEETEIIDVKSKDELYKTWRPFIHTHHYRIKTSFHDSLIGCHPRRSCEAVWSQTMQCEPMIDRHIPVKAGFRQLWEWYSPLVEAEKRDKSNNADLA